MRTINTPIMCVLIERKIVKPVLSMMEKIIKKARRNTLAIVLLITKRKKV